MDAHAGIDVMGLMKTQSDGVEGNNLYTTPKFRHTSSSSQQGVIASGGRQPGPPI